MASDSLDMLELAGAFGEPNTRPEAAAALARALGGEALVLFAPDPELGVLLPASGLPQTLRGAAQWPPFLEACRARGEHVGTLTGFDGRPAPAHGCARGEAVAVLLGKRAAEADLRPVSALLPLIGPLLVQERRVGAAEARARSAQEMAKRAAVLTRALNDMRERLQGALTEAERARLAAETANRAKSEFLTTMSHELRTPINAVLGYGELLEMGIPGPITPTQRNYLERIRTSSQHLLALVNDVLDLAKVEAGHLSVEHRVLDANAVVMDSLALVQMQYLQRGVRLENVCDEQEVPYVGDESRVRQILVNLLSNAGKFTPPGGTVSIRCGTTTEPDPEARLRGAGRWTYIRVEDTGIGIDAESVGRVFQPFVQVEEGHTRTRGGTGLGLTISRQLARLMGGDLTLRTQHGRGSCFTLWLPTDTVLIGALDETIRV